MRYYQREEAKCSFCMYWFPIKTEIKGCLNVCEECIAKALSKQALKVPSGGGNIYQLHLRKIHYKIDQKNSNSLLQLIDKKHLEKYEKIAEQWERIASKVANQPHEKSQEIEEIIRRYSQESIVREEEAVIKMIDAICKQQKTTFQEFSEPIEELFEELEGKKVLKCLGINRTPVKEKININQILNIATHRSISKSGRSKDNRTIGKQNGSSCIGSMKTSLLSQDQFSGKGTIKTSRTGLKVSNFQLLPPKSKAIPEEGDCKTKSDFKLKCQHKKNTICAFLEQKSTVPTGLIKLMAQRVIEAIQSTNNINGCLQLVGFPLGEVDLLCYLNHLQWDEVDVLKLVKVGLIDEQFKLLVDFLSDKGVQTLVTTNNNLSQEALLALNQDCNLKHIYLGNNQMNLHRSKNVKELRQRYQLYL